MSIGSININPGDGFIGTFRINSDIETTNTLTVNGPISITAGKASALVTGTIENVNIQRLAVAQSFTISPGYKSNISSIIVNSVSKCLNAQFAAVTVNVDQDTGSLGSLTLYGTRFTAGIAVTANGPVDNILIAAEANTNPCTPIAVTGAINVGTNSKSIRAFAVKGLATVSTNVLVSTKAGNISSFVLEPKAGGDITVTGDFNITTLVASTGSVESAVVGPLASVGRFTAEALGGSIGSAQILGTTLGTRFNAAFTVSSAGAPVTVKTGSVRSVTASSFTRAALRSPRLPCA